MGSSAAFETTFDRDGNLHVNVRLTGPYHVFNRNRGYAFREYFDWHGRRWLLNFLAVVTPNQTGTTHGMLTEVRDEGGKSDGDPAFDELFRKIREAQNKSDVGWRLTRFQDGIEGCFHWARLRPLPSGKTGSFASFNIEIGGVLYFGQLRLSEQPHRREKPTEWDWSRGAKAGAPSLGKRR
jgi:hypothetical protein